MRPLLFWSSMAIVGCVSAFTACGDTAESTGGGKGGEAQTGGAGDSSTNGGVSQGGSIVVSPGGTGGKAGSGGTPPEGGTEPSGGMPAEGGSGAVSGAAGAGAGGAGGAGGELNEPQAPQVPTCGDGGVSSFTGIVGFWHGENNFDDAFGLHPGANAGVASFGTGQLGTGFSLTGVANSFVTIPDSPSFVMSKGITMDAWINATQLGGRIFDKITASGADGFLLDTYGGKLRMKIGGETLTSDTDLPTATWVHVAGTYDGKQMRIAMNGVTVGTMATTTPIPSNTHALRIGADAVGGSLFAGVIDEPRIYNRGMSVPELGRAQLASMAKVGAVSWWSADGSSPFADVLGHNSGSAVKSTQTLGVVGWAQQLDGTVGSFAKMPDSTSLDFTTAITMEAWIKPKTLGGRIFDKITGGLGDGYLLDTYAGKLRMAVGAGVASTTTSIAVDVWTHVAGVYDGTSIKLFINGAPQGGAPFTVAIPTNALPLQLGADSNGASRFDGMIDEARIYGRALTAGEVNLLYFDSYCDEEAPKGEAP